MRENMIHLKSYYNRRRPTILTIHWCVFREEPSPERSNSSTQNWTRLRKMVNFVPTLAITAIIFTQSARLLHWLIETSLTGVQNVPPAYLLGSLGPRVWLDVCPTQQRPSHQPCGNCRRMHLVHSIGCQVRPSFNLYRIHCNHGCNGSVAGSNDQHHRPVSLVLDLWASQRYQRNYRADDGCRHLLHSSAWYSERRLYGYGDDWSTFFALQHKRDVSNWI
jgi:hypothetical protein